MTVFFLLNNVLTWQLENYLTFQSKNLGKIILHNVYSLKGNCILVLAQIIGNIKNIFYNFKLYIKWVLWLNLEQAKTNKWIFEIWKTGYQNPICVLLCTELRNTEIECWFYTWRVMLKLGKQTPRLWLNLKWQWFS